MARRDANKRWLAVSLIAILATALYWMAIPRASQPAKAPEPARPPSAPHFSPKPFTTDTTPRPKPSKAGDSVEICGIGTVRPAADDEGAFSYVSDLATPAMRRWLGALRNSDDYRARATGIFVSSVLDNMAGQQAEAQTARAELVAMADGSIDPAIYAIALKSCAMGSAELNSSCSQLSLEGWAKRDPDNAIPWLLEATRFLQDKDAAGEADAFARAGSARKSESYTDSLLSFAQRDMPSGTTPLESWSLATSIIGIQAASGNPIGPVFSYCSKEAMSDKAVAEHCAALAELWVAHPKTLLDLAIGEKLGERVGWSQARLADLNDRVAAYKQLFNDALPLLPNSQWTCEAIAQGNALLVKLSRLGEVGAAQEMLDRSGKTAPELAAQYTEAVAKVIADARRAAQEKALP